MAGEAAVRRLDRGDQGPLAVGTVRAFDRRHRNRLRDLHTVAEGLAQAALRLRCRGLTRARQHPVPDQVPCKSSLSALTPYLMFKSQNAGIARAFAPLPHTTPPTPPARQA